MADWVILPATAAERIGASHGCSFVELVATKPQPSCWFVSHFWGEPVLDFIACVSRHAKLRELPREAAYWVCAYANNQWDLAEIDVSDPKLTPFYRAMQASDGVLLILDAKATPFTSNLRR